MSLQFDILGQQSLKALSEHVPLEILTFLRPGVPFLVHLLYEHLPHLEKEDTFPWRVLTNLKHSLLTSSHIMIL